MILVLYIYFHLYVIWTNQAQHICQTYGWQMPMLHKLGLFVVHSGLWHQLQKLQVSWLLDELSNKVYMGLIIKGTIPRVPAFSLWSKIGFKKNVC